MSEVRANTFSDAAGTGPAALTGQHAAKSYLHYDAVDNAIDESFNVSSVTDNATGFFGVVFTNDMGTVRYAVAVSNRDNGCGGVSDEDAGNPPTASGFELTSRSLGTTATPVDRHQNSAVVFGDLA